MKQIKNRTRSILGLLCALGMVMSASAHRGYWYRPGWGYGYYGPGWGYYPYYYDPVTSAFVASAAISTMAADNNRSSRPREQSGFYSLHNNASVPVTVTTDNGSVKIAPGETADVNYKNRKSRISVRNSQGGGAGLVPRSQELEIEESRNGNIIVHSR